MKRRILSILFALVLVVTMSLVTAVPVGAATPAEYTSAVTKAADRLVATQNADGGFAWILPGNSAANCLGITAMGILKAHELEGKSAYETALAKAYKYAVVTVPGFAWDAEAGKWIEQPKYAVNRFPDITFLIGLAEAAAEDASLLAAINEQVPGITATDIAALAKARWDDRLAHLGSTQETPLNGTATRMAEYVRDARYAAGYFDCIPWDLEAAVKAALALEVYYPDGYAQQAVDIAEVIYDSLYGEPVHFDVHDTSQYGYILGLTGALEAFVEVGLHPDEVVALTTILLDEQQDGGYWNWHDPVPENVVESVQHTAYAVMALLREGSATAVVAAQSGADWLVSSQLPAGGWLAEGGVGNEYPEVDSEAAWAIKVLLDISASVNMTAKYIPLPPPEIGISVTPTSLNFGSLTPGAASAARTVTVTNEGNVAENFSSSLENISSPDVYTAGLAIDTSYSASTWGASNVAVSGIAEPSLVLTVPTGTAPGTYTATLVFWAEMH